MLRHLLLLCFLDSASILLLFAVSYLLDFREERKLLSNNGLFEVLTAVSMPTRTDERYTVIARHTRRNPRNDLNCWCHRSSLSLKREVYDTAI